MISLLLDWKGTGFLNQMKVTPSIQPYDEEGAFRGRLCQARFSDSQLTACRCTSGKLDASFFTYPPSSILPCGPTIAPVIRHTSPSQRRIRDRVHELMMGLPARCAIQGTYLWFLMISDQIFHQDYCVLPPP